MTGSIAMRLLVLLTAIVIAGVLTPLWLARQTASAAPTIEPIRVVATTGMIADLVRMIALDGATPAHDRDSEERTPTTTPRVELVQLIASGVDPHLYAPTRRDMLHLESAQLVLHNGYMLEGRLGEAIERSETVARRVHAVAERVIADGYPPLREDDAIDPHLWMDLAAWSRAALVVGEALAEVDSTDAEAHRAAARRVSASLLALHEVVVETIATIPGSQRLLVTAHDAFAYFGRAYDIEVAAIQGISTESEAGVRRISELADLIAARRVPAVFAESTVADRSIQALIEASASRGHPVRLGGELYSDAMGAPETPAGTYIGMIEHNVRAIVTALGGTYPEGGLTARAAKAPRRGVDEGGRGSSDEP